MKSMRWSRHAFWLLVFEGSFALAYETSIGSSYLSGLAGELRIPVFYVTLCSALPWFGAIGQFFALSWLHSSRSPKKSALIFSTIARSLWVLPVLLAAYWGARTYFFSKPFPAEIWFAITASVAGGAALMGSAGGVSWMSWMRALVPASIQGRFFGMKSKFSTVTMILIHAIAALLVGFSPSGYRIGYAALGLLALFCAFFSSYLLMKVPRVQLPASTRLDLHHFKKPWHDGSFRRLIFFSAAFNGSMMLAAPYFSYYFTGVLQIPMRTVALWSVAGGIGGILFAPLWGRWVDRYQAHRIWWLATIGFILTPLPYLLPKHIILVLAPFEFFVSGALWTGHTVGLLTQLMKQVPKGVNSVYYSTHSVLTGIVSAFFAVLGGQIISSAGGGVRAFHLLWMSAIFFRFIAVFVIGGQFIRKAK